PPTHGRGGRRRWSGRRRLSVGRIVHPHREGRLRSMVTFLTIVHVFVCLFLILVVLLQAGKGGGMGIAFGGAGSQTVFGSSGAGNFLTKLTTVTAAVFMITSLGLAHYSSIQDSHMLQEIAAKNAAPKPAHQ